MVLQNWVFNIIAGLLGALFSISIFYQVLERRWTPYRRLSAAAVVRVTGADGNAHSDAEQTVFIDHYNRLAYIGKSQPDGVNFDEGVTVQLADAEQLRVVKGERFYEVERTKKNHKRVYFRLFDRPEQPRSGHTVSSVHTR